MHEPVHEHFHQLLLDPKVRRIVKAVMALLRIRLQIEQLAVSLQAESFSRAWSMLL